eukprot:scaffold24002_cov52-Phaeocystis_antarctica.AAC.2
MTFAPNPRLVDPAAHKCEPRLGPWTGGVLDALGGTPTPKPSPHPHPDPRTLTLTLTLALTPTFTLTLTPTPTLSLTPTLTLILTLPLPRQVRAGHASAKGGDQDDARRGPRRPIDGDLSIYRSPAR